MDSIQKNAEVEFERRVQQAKEGDGSVPIALRTTKSKRRILSYSGGINSAATPTQKITTATR